MNKDLKIYRAIAQNLYSHFTLEDGVDTEEIEQAAKSHGFRLPKILREFYLLAGDHQAINASFNELLSVDDLTIEDNKLIFYRAHQGVCYWAIDLTDIEKDDPPVWIGQSIVGQEKLEWYLEAENLSGFLLIMLCWQSVMGGLPFSALADKIEESVKESVKNNFSFLETGTNYSGLRAFTDHGKVICLAESETGTGIYVAASDKEKFLEIENLLKIKWDYRSLDD